MNYYEELGVRQDAPVEDIRQAYKKLARLLHPDSHTEPDLKSMAERQMQRLVGITAVLSDPKKRSQYDEALWRADRLPAMHGRRLIPLPPAPAWKYSGNSRLAEFVRVRWFWVLNGVFVLALGTWVLLQKPAVSDLAVPRSVAPREPFSKRRPAIPKTYRRLSSGADSARGSIIPAGASPLAESTPLFVPPEPVVVPEAEENPAGRANSAESMPELPEIAFPATPPVPNPMSFTGRWLYAPRSGDIAEKGTYSASYIELSLVEHAGELSGVYHARYNVFDQAVSPEVIFKIRGMAGSSTSKVSWSSADNARGEAEMVLRAANVLYINWWTTEFGPRAALASGSAVLIRLRAP